MSSPYLQKKHGTILLINNKESVFYNNVNTPYKTCLNITKHNLALLHFTIRSDLVDEPLLEGPHQVIYTYVKKGIDNVDMRNLDITAIDKENICSLDPISVDKWINWWEYFVLPALLENDFNDDLMIVYPDADTDLTKL